MKLALFGQAYLLEPVKGDSHKKYGNLVGPVWDFLDALASLDFKLSLSQSFTFFIASASTGLSELF